MHGYQLNFVEPTLPQKVLCRRIDPEHVIGRMRSPRLTVSDLCSVHVSQQIFGQMRAGIPTQLKVFDCEPAAKRREQLSLVCALDSGHNQVRFGTISQGRLQMTAVKCTNPYGRAHV